MSATPESSRLTYGKVATLIVLGLVAGVFVAELALRIRDQRFEILNFVLALAQYDPELGWVARGYTPDDGSRIERDNQGLAYFVGGIRSNGVYPRRTRRPILLAVGDSFTVGAGVQDDETWPAWLERTTELSVYNAGVRGYGLDQIVLLAERLVEEIEPDGLIVSLIPECVERCELSHRSWSKPWFDVVDGALVLRNTPVRPASRYGWIHRTLGYSYLAHRLMMRIAPAGWQGREHRMHDDGPEVAVLLMRRLDQLAASRSLPVIVLIQYQPRVRSSLLPLLERAQTEHLQILDLWFDATEHASHDEDSCLCGLYLRHGPDAGHLNAEGNRRTAMHLASFIEKHGIFGNR